MPPAYVKPYVKRHKNDAADAEAICEAVTRANMRFVPTKTREQQSCLMLQRTKPAAFGVKAPYPGFVEPALATSVDKVPSGERWIHEIKFDGYRVQLHIANDDIKIFTRRGNDWTKRFKKIAADAYLINAGLTIIDGEVVVPAEDGTTDFSVLQNELKGKSTNIVMVAFDLLYLNGYDLRKLPLVERKSHLKKLCKEDRTAAFGLSPSSWLKSNTAPNQRRAKCGILFLKVCGRICDAQGRF